MGSLQIVVLHPQRKEKNCANVIFPIVFCSFYVIVSSEAGRSYVAAGSQGKLEVAENLHKSSSLSEKFRLYGDHQSHSFNVDFPRNCKLLARRKEKLNSSLHIVCAHRIFHICCGIQLHIIFCLWGLCSILRVIYIVLHAKELTASLSLWVKKGTQVIKI